MLANPICRDGPIVKVWQATVGSSSNGSYVKLRWLYKLEPRCRMKAATICDHVSTKPPPPTPYVTDFHEQVVIGAEDDGNDDDYIVLSTSAIAFFVSFFSIDGTQVLPAFTE